MKTKDRRFFWAFQVCSFLFPLITFSQITVNLQTQNPQCGGFNSGVITAIPIGGSSPYTYLWSTGSTNNPITNLGVGTYTVTVTDANSVTGTATTTLTSPPPLLTQIVVTDCGLPGAMEGVVTGGIPPYDYEWSTGATTATISGLSPGEYCITVIDNNACAFVTCEFIGAAPFVATMSTSPAICGSGSGGSATAQPSGGVSPYDYDWNTGGTTQSIANLAPGDYTVTITADNGCTLTETGNVGIAPGNYSVSLNVMHPECEGTSTGSLTANSSGGISPYTYQWSNGQSGQSINNLPAGTYTVTSTDAYGCTSTQLTLLSYQSTLSVTTNNWNPTCAGINNGSVTAVGTNGVTPYEYDWDNGATTQTINNLGPGTYKVTVTDDLGCTGTASATLVSPAPFEVNVTATNATQCGAANGSVSASPSGGGNPPYSYLWNNGATGNQLNNIGAGTYSVTVTSAQGCTASGSATVNQPNNLLVNITGSTLVCGNDDDGVLQANPTHGTAPYIYNWSNGGNTQVIINLPSGTYTVTVTSSEGCTGTATKTINGNPPIELDITVDSVSCHGLSDGMITVVPSGGTPPLEFEWSTGSNSTILTGLTAGTYDLTVTDAIGCSVMESIEVAEPGALSVNFTTPPGSCGNNGYASATVTGGTLPYAYEWSTGETTNSIFGLPPGNFTLSVTDAHACSVTAVATIPAFPLLSLTVTSTNTTCNGTTDGTATATATGGTPPFEYLWSNGQTSSSLTGLTPGNYSVTVTDSNTCSNSGSITIQQGAGLNVTIDAPAFVCPGELVSATVIANGGTPDYTYEWSNGQTTQTAVDLSPGTFTVTVTDPTGCSGDALVTLYAGGGFSVNYTFENIDCNGSETGLIDLEVTGGLPPYQYLWNQGDTLPGLDSLPAGDYTVTVSDSSGCETILPVTLTEPPALLLNLTGMDGTCGGPASVLSTVSGGTPLLTYLWNTGDETVNLTNLDAGTYTLTITDANDCKIADSVVVDVIPQPVCTVELTQAITTQNGDDGKISVVVEGGTAPFTYQWSDGQTTGTATGLAGGIYIVTVTDANNCQTVCNFTLYNPVQIGDFVWLDKDRDGIQDADEDGFEGVEIILTGTDDYGSDISVSTMSDMNGEYELVVSPGTYILTFLGPDGYVASPSKQGSDQTLDSDPSQITNKTSPLTMTNGAIDFTIDAGFFVAQPCDNVSAAGSICCDQTLCGPGMSAATITQGAGPSGGSGDLQYVWMYSMEPGPFDPNTWTPVDDSNSPEFDPGPVYETTYFIRSVRREGCIEFLGSNQVTVQVDSIAVASIDGPASLCVFDSVGFEAFDNGPGASYLWSFEEGSPASVATRIADGVVWETFGKKIVSLEVEKEGCTSIDTMQINITNSPAYCGNALIIKAAELNSSVVQVDWFYTESDTIEREYEIEWAWEDGDFESIGEPDSTVMEGQYIHFFKIHPNARRGRNFYRVRLTDSNETQVMSNTALVQIVGNFSLVHVFPNPFSDYLDIEVIEQFNVPISIELVNVLGQNMKVITLSEGEGMRRIDTSHLIQGYYFLLVKYDGRLQKLYKLVKRD